MRIGILALQGDVALHASKLAKLQVDWQVVRYPADLATIDGLILPGGESSVLLTLLQVNHLLSPLRQFNKPMMGTCAGAILLAETVCSPEQASLAKIQMTIRRNAYGRQLASRIEQGEWVGGQEEEGGAPSMPIEMVFIRAPEIIKWQTAAVKVIATSNGYPVAVQQGMFMAMTFHPELTNQTICHHYFIAHCAAVKQQG